LKQLPHLHEEAFEKINCLNCAACCKNYSPRFKTSDIKRISKHLKMRESEFIDAYLKLDEDGDYVVKSRHVHSWVQITFAASMKSGHLIVFASLIQMKMFY